MGNVGGRITPATLRTMTLLGKVRQATADTHVLRTWNLVILHHTDCGMTDLAPYPDLVADYFEIPQDELAGTFVVEPNASLHADVEVILDTLHGSDFLVPGLGYDVDTAVVNTRDESHRLSRLFPRSGRVHRWACRAALSMASGLRSIL